ncbi:MAG: TonB-dependent receptor [Thermoanaerobaculia bacterium]|nr:TonB-dependent receptor [Thermoanaerobaculia bacterium]
MNRERKLLIPLTLVAALLVLPVSAAWAQGVTTGNLRGTVTAQEDASRLPGVSIEAVHTPTGTTYDSITDAEGRFQIVNVRVGGPYTLTATLEGFQTEELTGIEVNLGQATQVDMALELAEIEETVTVVADVSPIISANRMGTVGTVNTEQIENLPTIGRSLEELTRTHPMVTVSSQNEDPDSISVAGRNTRYNNIQIDGAVNNDLFGLADTGTPGGQTETTPISLDAIEEIQVAISPYDVRQGGFSGGGINAITRSGSNSYKGSVFYFSRDDGLVGDGPDRLGEFGTFDEEQYGFRFGGPILRDELFFFTNGEISDKTEPTGWSLNGESGQAFANGELLDEAQLVKDVLIDRYGFDPGGFDQQNRDVESDKFFGRLDWNAGDSHQVTLRHNYVDASNLINRPGPFSYEWDSEAYVITDETNSTVFQANSVFGPDKFNEFRVSYQTIEDRRSGLVTFPWIEIEDVAGSDREFEMGTEPFSTRNSLDQEIWELTNDFTWLMGDHTITLGTHNEFFTFENLFVQNAFGSYEFATLEDFLAGTAREFEHTFPNPGQDPVASFDVNQFGLYAGDQWTVTDDLTLTYGLRVDVPFFPDDPGYNPDVDALYGFRTDELPDGEAMWSPRLGFNWNLDENQQVRGGAGIFAGRTPYVWVSNQYSRNALVFTDIRAFGNIPFNPDPFNQPKDIAEAGTQEVNLIDPAFQFPQVLRLNLGYDVTLPWWDLFATVEALHADSQEEIAYKDLNLVQVGTQPFDGRPVFERRSDDFNGAYLLTNTSEGEQTNVSVKLERPARSRGPWGYVSYTWGDSEVINDGTSSRAVSNFQFNEAVDPNNPQPSPSDFEVEHRFNASISHRFDWGDSGWATTASLFYNHQSGRPYSNIYGFQVSQVNGDSYFFNDLLYVPATQDDVVIVGDGTWGQLDAYIASDPALDAARGGIVERNASEAPWWHTLDLHLAQEIPVRSDYNFEITFDLLNVMNLIDEDSGVLRFANFNTVSPVDFIGVTDDGRPIYALNDIVTDPENNDKFETHNLRSRWRAKLGLRFTF